MNHAKDRVEAKIRAEVAKMQATIKKRRKLKGKKRKPVYDEHVVCFLDLLGFRDRVMSVGVSGAKAEIERLENLFENVVQPYDDDPLNIKVNYFTDCVCVALRLKSDDLKGYIDKIFWFLLQILHIQGECIFQGDLVRGGIVIDRHYSSERLIFSRAQIRAYEIESRSAVFPHVLIDETVFARLRAAVRHYKGAYPGGKIGFNEDVLSISKLIAEREDGGSFVNYLAFWRELDDGAAIRKFFEKHKDIVEKGAKSNLAKPSVLTKYAWLARYHNEYAAKVLQPPLMIDPAAFGTLNIPPP